MNSMSDGGGSIALFDVGKTQTKLLLIDGKDARILRQAERASTSQSSALGPQLDVVGIERWLRAELAVAPQVAEVTAIVPVAHGAAAVLIDENGVVLAAPDYENPEFESVADLYRPLRDEFAATLSPFLPLGLNLGRQLFWLQQNAPEVIARCRHILTYPQYWAWRFSGVAASELTSLGCHTDLWLPLARAPSRLAVAQEWADKLPPLRGAQEVLGEVRSDWAQDSGLDPRCLCVCGIHDSNASYLAYSLEVEPDEPFAVVSSGTWTVVMARGADLGNLVESRDMLANIDLSGRAVATARFPGGREYQAIAGTDAARYIPDEASLLRVLHDDAFALPSFAPAGGPFAGRAGRMLRADRLDERGRTALAALYLALMTDLALDSLDAHGELLLDGPLADNNLYARILATLRPMQPVRGTARRGGIVQAALHLASRPVPAAQRAAPAQALPGTDTLLEYRARWRRQLPHVMGHVIV
jgi:L-fuculokinase